MQERIPALIFGSCLLVVGVVMLQSQRQMWQRVLSDPSEADDIPFLKRRYRRRSQVAGMIILIALMIPIGDSLIPWEKAPATFAVYWMIVLGLAIWTGLLAVGDIASTRAHMMSELNRLHRRELQLRDAAERLRNAEGQGRAER
ncbi:hypothetical protein [Planctomicrobium piriforme]|uniref:Uncharacterized protein n=1 Tax=Planctomicrobium piriforme TaxID=1576369 RepID=A0A1I3BHJ9_9PLAN|nr:hypothetical protein [Planctomicrobium piriforme]SFH61753.1 hypothetical protein SAMN05421753_101458 [Planctomicrobium piriforme]